MADTGEHDGSGRPMNISPCRAWVKGRVVSQNGSAVLFALFACVAVMASIQVLTVAVICCERALADEVAGRRELAAFDIALASLCSQARTTWGPVQWTPVGNQEFPLTTRLLSPGESPEWVLRAEVAPDVTPVQAVTSALIERGRDGLDLPLGAIIARCVQVTEGRSTAWLNATGAEDADTPTADAAVAYVESMQGPEILGEGCSIRGLETEWSLGEGWNKAIECGAVEGPDIVLLDGSNGQTLRLEVELGLGTSERPALVVITGGADLDARDSGVLWAVVVADEASVLLDGTVVHGAVFTTETADLGGSGQVVYDAEVLRWATDRSFERTRLVPGTRLEDTQ
jgi:hypothetical protein